jgi:anti-sigma factor RsiW
MSRDDFDRELAAFRDGELPRLRRLRVAWRLRRDADARRRLAALERVAALLRAIDADGPAPDLWESVRLRLPALDAARAEAAAAPARRGLGPALGWGAAGALAAAAAAAALFLRLGDPALPPVSGAHGAVRWLDARGLPMMVLRDDAEGTIIWVPERPPADAMPGRPAGDATSGREEVRHGVV